MSAIILATKLHIPPHRNNVIPRHRLIERLNEGLHRKLILVSAPAGFGKTTLVSGWIAASRRTAAWLSLDEGDNDIARFWSHFIAALQAIAPNFGTAILSAFRSPQTPLPESILISLLNEIVSISQDFILVLDDYHLIESAHISTALAFLIERQPPHMHLVIATREDPRLPLARLRARDQLLELRVEDLRFTNLEAADFLNQAMGLSLAPQDVTALESRTEGWIAGLQLAALSMQGLQDVAGFIRSFTGSHRFVLDYLLEEVLFKQPETIQVFLLQTSILERMCGSLCDAVLHNSANTGQETLEQLERANLFVIPLDQERKWYRYHHLFRELLRQRLMRKSSSEEIARLHIRASEWLEANGETAGAFHHAIAATDVDRAARLAESAWQAMDESFQTVTWLGWVNQLPPGVIRIRPVLCTQIGWAYMDSGNVKASESSLRDAEQSLKLPLSEIIVVEKEQFQSLPARIAFSHAYNAQSQHRFAEAVRYGEQVLNLIHNEDDFLYVQASTVLSGSHWANGNLDSAHRLISNFVEASKRTGKFYFAIAATFGRADILTAQGHLREVQQIYQQALELAAVHQAEHHTAYHHLGLGMLYHEMGEDERALGHLQKGFELGKQTTLVDWAYRKSLAQAHLKASEGDLDNALELLDEAQRFYIQTPIPNLRPVDALKARIFLKLGNLLKAQEWAHNSEVSLRDTPDYLHEFERLTLVRVLLAEYQKNHTEPNFEDMLMFLNLQLKLAEEQNRLLSRIEILITQTLVFHAMGETTKALASLELALMLAQPEGYLRIFASEGNQMMELLSKLGNVHLKIYAEKISSVFARPQKNHHTSVTPQLLIDPLSERELEVLRLIAQGLSNQEITRKLFVALSTVKGHNLRIFAKLQAKSRTEAVARARELGLL